MLRLSGPMAVELHDLEIASLTVPGDKGVKFVEIGCCLWRLQMILREKELDLWLVMLVNCLVNALAMFCGEERTVLLNEIG